MKIDIDNTFIRYGRLHLTKQKGYNKNSKFNTETFHAPPAPRGFYAMPIRFQEMFLIGSLEKTQPDYMKLPKNIKDNDMDYNEVYKIRKKRNKKLIHKFKVNNDDEVWHHLKTKNNVVIDAHGTWVKTTVREWKKALNKESLDCRSKTISTHFETTESDGGKRIQEVDKKTGIYSKDQFEVFFDKKVY